MAKWGPLDNVINTVECCKGSVHMLCTFHALTMSFFEKVHPKLPHTGSGKNRKLTVKGNAYGMSYLLSCCHLCFLIRPFNCPLWVKWLPIQTWQHSNSHGRWHVIWYWHGFFISNAVLYLVRCVSQFIFNFVLYLFSSLLIFYPYAFYTLFCFFVHVISPTNKTHL